MEIDVYASGTTEKLNIIQSVEIFVLEKRQQVSLVGGDTVDKEERAFSPCAGLSPAHVNSNVLFLFEVSSSYSEPLLLKKLAQLERDLEICLTGSGKKDIGKVIGYGGLSFPEMESEDELSPAIFVKTLLTLHPLMFPRCHGLMASGGLLFIASRSKFCFFF